MKETFFTRYEFSVDKDTFRATKYEDSRTGKTVKVDIVHHWTNCLGEAKVHRHTVKDLEDVLAYTECLFGFSRCYKQVALALRLIKINSTGQIVWSKWAGTML